MSVANVDSLVKASSRKTPQPTPASLSEASNKQQLTGTTYRVSTLRRDCLIRDHHRCVISRKFDLNEALSRAKKDGINAKDDDGYWLRDEIEKPEFLEVAHILPHSLMSFSTSSGKTELVWQEYTGSQFILTNQPLERLKENCPCNSRYVRSRYSRFDQWISH
jgi:hypothetical protein